MKKFVAITSVLVLAFAVSSVVLAQKTQPTKKATTAKTTAQHMANPKMRTAKGEVSAVDVNASSLTLTVKKNPMAFSFDNQTKITESGRTVQPSAITSGMRATVKYMERDGKNYANSISLHPARGAKQSTSKKMSKSTGGKTKSE